VNLKIIYLTHCHGDHIAALENVYDKYKDSVKILIHENDKEGIFDDDKNCKYILDEPNFVKLELDDIDTAMDSDIIKLEKKNNVQLTNISSDNNIVIYYKNKKAFNPIILISIIGGVLLVINIVGLVLLLKNKKERGLTDKSNVEIMDKSKQNSSANKNLNAIQTDNTPKQKNLTEPKNSQTKQKPVKSQIKPSETIKAPKKPVTTIKKPIKPNSSNGVPQKPNVKPKDKE